MEPHGWLLGRNSNVIVTYAAFTLNYAAFTLKYVAFTLNGFDDQERNLTFVKTNFQVLTLKFYACIFKQAFYPLRKLYIA